MEERTRAAHVEWQFVQFMRDLLADLPGITDLEVPGSGDIGADFIARSEGQPLLVEMKSQTPQTNPRLQQLGCFSALTFAKSGFTTCGTRRRVCCSPKASRPGS